MAATITQAESGSTELAVPKHPYRTLHVLVYPSPLFAAHWSFWLPYPDTDAPGRDSDMGDRIHATGDRLNGF